MLHAQRFPGVGDVPATSLWEAAWSMVQHPLRALSLFVTPVQKAHTLVTLALSSGGVALLSPEALLLAAPNLAERMLSNKQEMWGTAFHYSLVTSSCFIAGGTLTLSRWRRRFPSMPDAPVAVAVVACVLASWAMAARPPDLLRYEQPYFATSSQVQRYQRALSYVRDNDAVVAQNYFLPHVALREHIWLPEARFISRADVVVLDSASSPWPHRAAHVQRLIDALQRDAAFEVVFHEETTFVFRRSAGRR